MASFKELDVFQSAILMVKYIYDVTAKFPDEEKFGIISQIRRAAIGIPSRIADGASHCTLKDRQYSIDIALGALNEIYAQFLVAQELQFLPGTELKRFERGYDTLRPKLIAYQRSILVCPNS
ncbi:four helix bundle protein [bacterium]|nr:four helix bundle protein [bacterium]